MNALRSLLAAAMIAAAGAVAPALDMYPVCIDGLWGYASPDGHILVNPVFDNASDFADGMAAVCIDGRWGYIDENRELAIKPTFDDAMPFSEGLASVRLGERWTVVDRRGVPVSEDAIFDSAPEPFHDARSRVTVGNLRGFINRRGAFAIPAIYLDARDFSEGLALVTDKDRNSFFIDPDGKTVLQPEGYEAVNSFSEGLAAIADGSGRWGFIDTAGEPAIPCTWGSAGCFAEGLAPVFDPDAKRWGFIDRTGRTVVDPSFDHVCASPENVIISRNDSGTRIMSNSGTTGIAYVGRRGRFGLFNLRDTALVVEPLFDWITEYGEIFALEKDGTKFYAVPSGKLFDNYPEACDALAAEASFSAFARRRIEPAVNAWQRKGRYEKSTDYVARVNNDTRRAIIERMAREAEIDFITRYAPYVALSYKLSDYDADNEVFLITTPRGSLLVPVPLAEAPAFEQNFDAAVKTPAFGIENDRLDLAEVRFTMPDGREYNYLNSATVNFAAADIDYHFEPFVVEKAAAQKGRQNISTVKMSVGRSDVDVDIPAGSTARPETFAVVIGNENYTKAQPVEFAATDAAIFAEYCRTTLGLPEANVRHYPDATYLDMLDALADIRSIADAYKGGIDIIFYYAGHGLPDDASGTPHLMPVDSDGSRLDFCLPLSKLYADLAATGARSVTVFMDACFSGTRRGEGMINEARAVRRRVRSDAPLGRTVVFSAASGDETAYPYREKSHGLFTYYLLRKLRESKGELTLGELADYISDNVRRQATVANRRSQTPTVAASAELADGWRGQKIR